MQADLYALGALAWYLLTGTERRRFSTTLPSDHAADLITWDAFIDGCCRTRPERRFESVGEALASLGSVVSTTTALTANPRGAPNMIVPKASAVTLTVASSGDSSAKPTNGRPRNGRWAQLVWVAVAAIVVLGIYLRRHDIASTIPGASRLLVDYRRGFGDTVLKYSSRSYDGASWKKVQGSDSLSAIAAVDTNSSAITLTQVVGWDDDHYWVLESEGSILRCRNGSWNLLGRCKYAKRPVATAVDQETLLIAGSRGYAHETHVYEVSPQGTVDLGQVGGNIIQMSEIHAIAKDLSYFFSENSPLVKVADGKLSHLPEDKYKEAFVHRGDNTPLKEYLTKRVRLIRSYSAGKAIGIGIHEWDDGNRKIVSFQNGVWHEIDELADRNSFNNIWLGGDDTTPGFLVLVGDDGYVLAHTINGKSFLQSVASPQETTSLKLISVWGVDLNKYWVMDDSGTVWERNGLESRVVVRGLYRDDTVFRSVWVSPRGTVYGVTEKDLYRLE